MEVFVMLGTVATDAVTVGLLDTVFLLLASDNHLHKLFTFHFVWSDCHLLRQSSGEHV